VEHRAHFAGVDRGLAAFAVVATADGTEVGRYDSPKPLQQASQACDGGPERLPEPGPAHVTE
jgi:hypothetical protein